VDEQRIASRVVLDFVLANAADAAELGAFARRADKDGWEPVPGNKERLRKKQPGGGYKYKDKPQGKGTGKGEESGGTGKGKKLPTGPQFQKAIEDIGGPEKMQMLIDSGKLFTDPKHQEQAQAWLDEFNEKGSIADAPKEQEAPAQEDSPADAAKKTLEEVKGHVDGIVDKVYEKFPDLADIGKGSLSGYELQGLEEKGLDDQTMEVAENVLGLLTTQEELQNMIGGAEKFDLPVDEKKLQRLQESLNEDVAALEKAAGGEAPTQEAPKQEAPKQEAPKQEAPKQEAPKQETSNPASAPMKEMLPKVKEFFNVGSIDELFDVDWEAGGLMLNLHALEKNWEDAVSKVGPERAMMHYGWQIKEAVEGVEKRMEYLKSKGEAPTPESKPDDAEKALKEQPETLEQTQKPAKPHQKKVVSPKAVSKVQNIMDEHDLTVDSDEMKELAGFKSTLGQRLSQKEVDDLKSGKGIKKYVRNVPKLKSDFIKNMDPSNYESPEAFKKAKDRLKQMPAGDFAKILAALVDDEDD
jgi:hypothetical protein